MRLLIAVNALALSVAASSCNEHKLARDARLVLINHIDRELGAVGAGKSEVVGFQYVKPAEALLAAQALAHEDFDQAAAQVQRILEYQKPDGFLPHLVYGSSVPSTLQWIPSNRTFHPGPAFWQQPSLVEHQEKDKEVASIVPFNTSTISAPPVAADVAWEIFRLAPYDSILGVKKTAVQFLCRVYEPLKKMHMHLFSTRRNSTLNGLLTVRHPWETFSSLSPHWKEFLANLKKTPDYEVFIRSIPEEARSRFAAGASTMFSAQDAVENMYEPMIYLAAHTHRRGRGSEIYSRTSTTWESVTYVAASGAAARFGVEDVEFNSLMLRSSLALVNIGRVLVEHSSVCTGFTLTRSELSNDVKKIRAMTEELKGALVGSNITQGLWNTSADIFADSSRMSLTTTHSLRGILPEYAMELDDDKKMRLMKHFLSEPGSFSFFCAQFPAVFLACSGDDLTEVAGPVDGHSADTTWVLFNYFVQRGFVRNKFPGLADYIRNKTRDMICEATAPTTHQPLSWFPISLTMKDSKPAVLTSAYDSHNGVPIEIFDDSYLGSTLAAAALLNILLPAVTAPPSPDTPPIDHRILTVIMCVELVVAFGVAMSCFLFSVYFVVNRPRQKRLSPGSTAHRRSCTGAAERDSRDKLDRHKDDCEDRGRSSPAERYSESSYSDYSPRSGHAPNELEEALISGADGRYGSFDETEQPQTSSNSTWKAAQKALAAISPW